MFGIKNKKQKENKEVDNDLEIDIESMKGDLEKPFQQKTVNLEIEKEKPIKKEVKKEKPIKKEKPLEESPFLKKTVNALPSTKESFLSEKLFNKEEVTSTTNNSAIKKEEELVNNTQKKNNAPSPTQKLEQINESKVNKPLLFIAVFVFLLTLGSGSYYYLFLNKSEEIYQEPIPVEEENIQNETKKITENNPIEIEEEVATGLLTNPFPLKISEEEPLLLTLHKLIEEKESLNPKLAEEGFFVKLSNSNGTTAQTSGILDKLSLDLSVLNQYIDDILIFIQKETFYKDNQEKEEAIRVSLFSKIKDSVHDLDVDTYMKNEEKNLPNYTLSLFLKKEQPSISEPIKFNQSTLEPKGRYFNYEAGIVNKSIDWAIIEDNSIRYLMISTSMQSTRKIVEKLAK